MNNGIRNNNVNEIKNIKKLVGLHLIPGIIIIIAYAIILKSGLLEGYPKTITFGIAAIPGVLLWELGGLFYLAKKETGRFNIFEILGLKSKQNIKEFIFWTIVLFGAAGVLMTICKPISNFLLKNVFSFIPTMYALNEDMSIFSRNMIIITIIVSFFMITLIYPIIEELYFRGFLMARMKWMGSYLVIFNLILFAIYHFWSPWMIVARIVAFLPLFYMVYKKDSLKLGITVHCLANFTDVIALISLL